MTKIEQVIEGLKLCRDWAEPSEVNVGHEVIYCSDGAAAGDMQDAGWHWDADLECWAIFV